MNANHRFKQYLRVCKACGKIFRTETRSHIQKCVNCVSRQHHKKGKSLPVDFIQRENISLLTEIKPNIISSEIEESSFFGGLK